MREENLQMEASAEKVIRHYADMVYRLAYARTGCRYDAEEVFQEVFLRYVKKQPAFENEEHRKAWILRVTVNCCKKLQSSAWRRRTQGLDEEIAFEEKEMTDLHQELQKLPPKYREVIHLFYYEDLPVEEISRILGRKNSTVRAQISRARAMLQKFMKEEDYV